MVMISITGLIVTGLVVITGFISNSGPSVFENIFDMYTDMIKENKRIELEIAKLKYKSYSDLDEK